RIPIRHLSPRQPENRWPAKSYLGEVVPFEATVFREGHGVIGAELLLTDPTGDETAHAMHMLAPGTDRWRVDVRARVTGPHRYRIRAYADDWGSWLHDATIKLGVGDDPELIFAMGAQLLERVPGKTAADARAAL